MFGMGPAFFGAGGSGGAPGTDPYWANVSALLHFEGANNSTTFTDQKGRTWTPSGGAKIITTASMIGSSAGSFGGGSDIIRTASTTDLDLSTGAATVEGYFLTSTSFSVIGMIMMRGLDSGLEATGSINYAVYFDTDNKLYFRLYGTTSPLTIAAVSGLNNGVKHHFRMCFDSASHAAYAFVDGTDVTQQAQGSYMGSSGSGASWGTTIGAAGVVWGQPFIGLVDEIRITKGVMRSTANFTPSPPWPDS